MVRWGLGAVLRVLATVGPLSQPLPCEGRGARNGSHSISTTTPPLPTGEGAGG